MLTKPEAKQGARSSEGPSPVSVGGMEPAGFCLDPECQWNQPMSEAELSYMGAPAGWTWPHRHEGQAVVLELSYE